MLQGWIVVAIALAYIGLLFVVASYGDRLRPLGREGRSRLLIYPLSLAIYCTSWTFFGSVGLASRNGYDFLAIYVGPVLMIALAYPLITRVVRLAKSQNITSIAEFIAARYCKLQGVAVIVSLIAIVGTIPLHRAAAQGGIELALDRPGADGDRRGGAPTGVRRHRAPGRARHGVVRDAVRHPPHRRDRAPARPDARDRDRRLTGRFLSRSWRSASSSPS